MVSYLYKLSYLLAIISTTVHIYLWTQNTPADFDFMTIGILFGLPIVIFVGSVYWAFLRKQHSKFQKSFFERTPFIILIAWLILFFYPFIAGVFLDGYGTLHSSNGSYYVKKRKLGKYVTITKEEYDRRQWGQSIMFTGSAISIWFLNVFIFRSVGQSKTIEKSERDSA